jgi:hypothetical protein
MKNIEHIIFDLGNVILNIDYQKTIEEFNKLGISNASSLYSQSSQSSIFDLLETGKISDQKFISEIKKLCPKKIKASTYNYGPYSDAPQPLGFRATVSAPYVQALALNELAAHITRPNSTTLDVGSGSGIVVGYMSHLASKNGGKVVGVEVIEPELSLYGGSGIGSGFSSGSADGEARVGAFVDARILAPSLTCELQVDVVVSVAPFEGRATG